jgi:poly-gamma-glutamate synthesis protein (capsule biosynthesis protein)
MRNAQGPKDCQCPPRASLVLLTVPYLDFEAQPKLGRQIVARSVADEVGKAFTEIFESRQFQIQRMELVDVYGGDDDASMAANNTSAFNCRLTTRARVFRLMLLEKLSISTRFKTRMSEVPQLCPGR